jgi:hypothetical protein
VAIAAVLRLQLVLSEKFDTVVRTTPEIELYVPHDSLICAVLRYVERAEVKGSTANGTLKTVKPI